MARAKFTNESTYKRFLEEGKEHEFDTLFERAANEVKASFGARNPMYINGEEVYAA